MKNIYVTKKEGVKETPKEAIEVKATSAVKTIDKVIGTRKFSQIIPASINNILKVAFKAEGNISVNSKTLDEVMEDLLEQKIHTTRDFEGIKRDDDDTACLDKAILKLMMYREYIYNKSKK